MIKSIATIFVVYIHGFTRAVNFADGAKELAVSRWLLLYEDTVSIVIAHCSVPVFFILSSILLFRKQRKYKKTVLQKTETILVSYLFWNTFWTVIFILFQNLSFASSLFPQGTESIIHSTWVQWLTMYGIGLENPFDYPSG